MTPEEVMIRQTQLDEQTPQMQITYWTNKLYDMKSRGSATHDVRFVESHIQNINRQVK